MNKILLDSDVVIDFVLERYPFDITAKEIFLQIAQGKIVGYMTSITPINVFYIGRKIRGATDTLNSIERLLNTLEIIAADKSALLKPFSMNFSDFEDAVQHACAEAENLDAIVTCNLADYKYATLPVYSPTDFLNLLKTP